MISLVKNGFHVLDLIKKNKILFAVSAVLDFSFMASFILVYYLIMTKVFDIMMRISELMTIMSDIPEELTGQTMAFQALAGNIEFLTLYSSLLRWLLVLMISIFLIWVILEGIAFSIAAKIVNKKKSFWKYLGKFSIFSLFFYVLIVLSFWLTIYLSILNSRIILPLFTQTVITIILVLLLISIKYFCGISLVIINKRKIIPAFIDTFKIGVRNILKILFIYLIIILEFVVCLLLIYLLFNLHILLFFLGVVVWFLPLISFDRLLFFYIIERIS